MIATAVRMRTLRIGKTHAEYAGETKRTITERRRNMRCDRCPFGGFKDETGEWTFDCDIAEGEYGIEHSDGMSGCKHPRNWVEKRFKEYSEEIKKNGYF